MHFGKTAIVIAAASLLLTAGYVLPSLAADAGKTPPAPTGTGNEQIEPGTSGIRMGPAMMGTGQAGPGMMGGGKLGPGAMGGTISPNQMGPWMMGGGMGRGMMGAGMMGPGWGYIQPSFDLTVDDVKAGLERYLEAWGNPHVKLGKVTDSGKDTITAEIVTQEDSLVERLEVDKQTGFFHMVP